MSPLARRVVLILATLAFLFVVLKNAWICDDAYITFRSVENVVTGHGLVWNPGERVQTFTNPLWTLALAALRLLTGELYLTTIALSVLLSTLAIALIGRRASDAGLGVAAVVALLCSRAFTDFSTSGLENPMGHLLIVLFVLCMRAEGDTGKKLFWGGLYAGLAIMNRMDSALFFAPVLLLLAWQHSFSRGSLLVACGFLPFLLWELFAFLYYGFPFPNTAYAKLGSGVESGALFGQGWEYLQHSLANDPVTLAVILLSGVLLLRERTAPALAAFLGLALSLVYVLRVGGDFMSGRFLAAPLVFAVAWAATTKRAPREALAWISIPIALVVTALAPHSHLTSGSDYGTDEAHRANDGFINIERAFYFQATALVLRNDSERFLQHPWIAEGRSLAERAQTAEEPVLRITGAIGFVGFFAGPRVRVYDIFALADPLLARLPAGEGVAEESVAIGHFARLIPLGFQDARKTGEPFPDPNLERFDSALRLATSGPLFGRERLKAVIALNLGRRNEALEKYLRSPPREVALAEIDVMAGPASIPAAGLDVVLRDTSRAPTLRLQCDTKSVYRVEWLLGDEEQGEAQVVPTGKVDRIVATPEKALESGFDRVRLVPLFGFGEYFLSGLFPEQNEG